jgi:Bacterial SH3 domain
MRSVRCDACGTKALMAASQCPKCGHLFEVRDGFGALRPLAYCSSCDSYYPESVGSCRWCGTTPAPAPNHPYIWKRAGVVALIVLAGLGWLMRDSRPKAGAGARTAKLPTPELTYVGDSAATQTEVTAADSSRSRVTTASEGNVEPVEPVAEPSSESPSAGARDPVAPQATARGASARAIPGTQTAKSSKPRRSARWVNSVARSWIIVRAQARRDARIVASIGPDSRVQLGESRGAWRRIRARGITGWVEEARSSFAAANRSTSASRLAVR